MTDHHRFRYPLLLDLCDRPCLVVGGGAVALRKAESLASAGARVTVVSPQAAPGLMRLARGGRIQWKARAFRPADLSGMRLVISATDDPAANQRAAREAGRRGIWINVADCPRLCSFILPSVVRRGRLVLAVSTGGASPALARWIRRDLGRRYGSGWAGLLRVMERTRAQVQRKVRGSLKRKKLLKKALRAYLKVVEGRG